MDSGFCRNDLQRFAITVKKFELKALFFAFMFCGPTLFAVFFSSAPGGGRPIDISFSFG
jgi:hypothetical protein